MDARRRELRLRWRDVADAAGISYETLRTIRRGHYDGMRPLTETGIEQALRWAPGSIATILAGGAPPPIPKPEPAPDPLQDPTYLRRRQRLQELWKDHGEHTGLLLFIQEIEAEQAEEDKSVTSDSTGLLFHPPNG